MGDLERLAGRAGSGDAGTRDLVAIADGLERLPLIANQLKRFSKKGPDWLADLRKIDMSLIELAEKINDEKKESAFKVLKKSLKHKGFRLLTLGFFVCGFQITLVATHVPRYVLSLIHI